MTRVAMPSPLHTNYERLYLPQRLAGDARPRQARDASSSDALTALQQFLSEVLSDPSDLQQAEILVEALLESTPNDDDPDADPDQTAADKRRRTAGDRPRRAWAGDRSAALTMAQRFPLARPITRY
jgi:hypothetical protein